MFLFFGLFRQTVEHVGHLRWDRTSKPVHAVFGYLQVGEVVRITSPSDMAQHPWAAEHPHVRDWDRPRNTLYVAADAFSLCAERSGAGLLRWSPRTCLTKPGATPSVWRLPSCFIPGEGRSLSFHGDPARWTVEEDGSVTLRSVGRGQEFVIDANDELERWLLELIEATAVVHGVTELR